MTDYMQYLRERFILLCRPSVYYQVSFKLYSWISEAETFWGEMCQFMDSEVSNVAFYFSQRNSWKVRVSFPIMGCYQMGILDLDGWGLMAERNNLPNLSLPEQEDLSGWEKLQEAPVSPGWHLSFPLLTLRNYSDVLLSGNISNNCHKIVTCQFCHTDSGIS